MPVQFIMSPIPTVTLGSVSWPTISYNTPTVPTFITPGLGSVSTEAPPDYAGLEIPQPVYSYPTAEIPAPTAIVIPTPPTIVFDQFNITVPDPDLRIPSASVNWAYQAYLGVILDTLAIQVAAMDSATGVIWSNWEDAQDGIWTDGYNLIGAFGYTAILAMFKNKELAYGRSLYNGARDALKEAYRARNARTYIEIILGIEKQKRSQYSQQKDLELAYAKDVIAKSLEHYGIMIRQYGALIDKYKILSTIFQGKIALAEAELKKLDAEIAAERIKGEISKALIARYEAQVQANMELIKLYETQMQLAKKLTQAEALHIDAFNISIRAFTLGVKNIAEQAQQQVISAETAAMMAKTDEAQLYASELGVKADTLRVEIQTLQAKLANEQKAVALRNEMMLSYGPQMTQEALIKGEEIDMREHKAREQERARVAEVEADLAISNARPQQAAWDFDTSVRVQGYEDDKVDQRAAHGITTDNIKYNMQDLEIERARQAIAETLSKAHIINRFIEHS